MIKKIFCLTALLGASAIAARADNFDPRLIDLPRLTLRTLTPLTLSHDYSERDLTIGACRLVANDGPSPLTLAPGTEILIDSSYAYCDGLLLRDFECEPHLGAGSDHAELDYIARSKGPVHLQCDFKEDTDATAGVLRGMLAGKLEVAVANEDAAAAKARVEAIKAYREAVASQEARLEAVMTAALNREYEKPSPSAPSHWWAFDPSVTVEADALRLDFSNALYLPRPFSIRIPREALEAQKIAIAPETRRFDPAPCLSDALAFKAIPDLERARVGDALGKAVGAAAWAVRERGFKDQADAEAASKAAIEAKVRRRLGELAGQAAATR